MGDHYDYDERPIEEEPAQRRKGGKIIALLALILLFIGFRSKDRLVLYAL